MFAMPMLMKGTAGGGFNPATEAYEWFDPTDSGSLTLVGGTSVSQWDGQRGNLVMTQGTASQQPLLSARNGRTVIQAHAGGTSSRSMGVTAYAPAYVAMAWWGTDGDWTSDATRSLFGNTSSDGYMPIGQDGSSTAEWERGYQGAAVFRDGVNVTPTNRNTAYDNIMNAAGVFEFVGLTGVESVGINRWGAGANPTIYQGYGYWGDIIYMATNPDDETRAAIREFLATKWGLA